MKLPLSLHPLLLENAAKRLNITECLPIQEQMLPILLESMRQAHRAGFHRDALVAAPTGSGKTLTYLLPVVNFLLTHSVCQNLKCVIVAPNKDLCRQIERVLAQLVRGSTLRYANIFGSNKRGFKHEHADILAENIDVLITTPVRLIDHINEATAAGVNFLANLKFLVVDEADKVVQDEKFKMLVHRIVKLQASGVRHVATPLVPIDDQSARESAAPSSVVVDVFADDYYGARENDFLMKMLFSATLTNDPKLLGVFNLKYPYFYSLKEPAGQAKKRARDESAKRPAADAASASNNNNDSSSSSSSDASDSDSEQSHSTTASFSSDDDDSETRLVARDSRKRRRRSLALPSTLLLEFLLTTPHDKTVSLFVTAKHGSAQKMLCFANSVDVTNKLFHVLCLMQQADAAANGQHCVPLTLLQYSSTLSVKARSRALRTFARTHDQKVLLVCSDGFARGFDVDGVELVVHYDVPQHSRTFVHRAGRTARAGADGLSLALLQREQVFHFKEMLGDDHTLLQRRLSDDDKAAFARYKAIFDGVLQQ